jgi:ribonuclease HII
VAAAVVFPRDFFLPDVDDSKRLAAAERVRLFEPIMLGALAVGVGQADHCEIDRLNILNASFLAMSRAIRTLMVRPGHLLVDGNLFRRPVNGDDEVIPFTTLVGGDWRSFSIAAASIIAKVTRDRIMCEFDSVYPGYEFARHKGYATCAHREAIERLGPCPIHRKTFLGGDQLALPL